MQTAKLIKKKEYEYSVVNLKKIYCIIIFSSYFCRYRLQNITKEKYGSRLCLSFSQVDYTLVKVGQT